ncbi:hypothetical protein BDN70DRAFT_919188 [Pholiota conissans]|uniref:F-box domain-containing protein n=1 Tax=Pholiota conissans TaxID=109636 RepID=A0A9P5Z6A6_9AGAR|nr:hypothetical protein BDN70DRAFT_919188 [Pholiota conissans]
MFAQRRMDGTMLPYSKWTRLTHVSRYWRDVSLNAPLLWAERHFGNERWLGEAFRRSQDVGLVINISGSAREHLLAYNFALRHSSRIRGLYILDTTTFHRYLWNRLRYKLTHSAPRLEFVELRAHGKSWLYKTTFGSHPRSRPHSLSKRDFQHILQRLRSVYLVWYHIDWDSLEFFSHALVHLTLFNLTIEDKPTAKKFILCLREVPNLEYLKLLDALPLPNSNERHDLPTDHHDIHFARLRFLHIQAYTIREIEAFFQWVTFPPDATVKVDCTSGQFFNADFVNILLVQAHQQVYNLLFHGCATVKYAKKGESSNIRHTYLDLMEPVEIEDQDQVLINPATLLYNFGRWPELRSFVAGTITNAKSVPNPIAVQLESLQDCIIRWWQDGTGIRSCKFRDYYGLGPWVDANALEQIVFDAVQNATTICSRSPSSNVGIADAEEGGTRFRLPEEMG